MAFVNNSPFGIGYCFDVEKKMVSSREKKKIVIWRFLFFFSFPFYLDFVVAFFILRRCLSFSFFFFIPMKLGICDNLETVKLVQTHIYLFVYIAQWLELHSIHKAIDLIPEFLLPFLFPLFFLFFFLLFKFNSFLVAVSLFD